MRVVCSVLVLLSFVLGVSVAARAGRVGPIVVLPGQPTIQAATRDAAGNWYLAGSVPPVRPNGAADTSDVFVAKISSGGTIVYSTTFGSSAADGVIAIALTSAGSLLVLGHAGTADFPVTPDAAQRIPVDGCSFSCYLARLDPNGNLVYATFLGTNAPTNLPLFQPFALATDSTGAAYITGQGTFSSTSGALPANGFNWFTLKVDPTGKLLFGTGLIGGTTIAVDNQGYIYIAGAYYQSSAASPLPVTPGAFQTTAPPVGGCGSAGLIGFPCFHQYVAKLDPTASTQIYTTWLTGSFNESVNALLVDGAGNVIVAGSTGSPDYPVTSGAYQAVSFATNPPRDYSGVPPRGGNQPGPPQTGYVTKLNATGSGLVFSTFLGGSAQDAITSMTPDSAGRLYLGGVTASPDFPGLFPDVCRPSDVYATPFLTRLDADGSALSPTQLAFGLTAMANNGGVLPSGGVASDSQGNAVAFLGSIAANLNFSALSPPLVCAADAADGGPVAQVAPGQLLSLFGEGLGQPFPIQAQPKGGFIPQRWVTAFR